MNAIFKKLSGAKKAIAALFVAGAAVAGIGFWNNGTAASGCPTNDIMPCGASTPAEFIKKLTANKPSDLQTIYADGRYKLPTSQYSRFASEAKAGKINPDNGNITVNGVTVGYNAQSLGRNAKSVSHPITIGGKTYHESPIKYLTKYFNDAMVLFDEKGNVQTVIMNLCGNPMTVTKNDPKYNCDMLNMTQTNRNTFTFTTKATATNGAQIAKVVYDFGDGQTSTQTSLSTPVSHTYANAGNYTAKATVYVKTTFGKSEFPITITANCQKALTVAPEQKPGVSIEKTVDGVKTKEVKVDQEFTYKLVVKNTGNVELKNAVVSDSQPAGVQFIRADKGQIANNAFSYTIPSLKAGGSVTINIVAKVTKYSATAIKNTACVDAPEVTGNPDDCDDATVTVTEPAKVEVCDPATGKIITVNESEASKYEPKDSPKCKDIKVCDLDTYTMITIKESAFDSTKHSKNPLDCEKVEVCNPETGKIITVRKTQESKYASKDSPLCKDVQVCDPATSTIITVKGSEASKYEPKDSPKCKNIEVCNLETGKTETIKLSDLDESKHSVNTADCDDVEVCNPETGKIITVKQHESNKYEPKASDKCIEIKVCVLDTKTETVITKDKFDETKHSTNMDDCKVTPVTPVTPPVEEPKTPQVKGEPAPTVLPSTGPAAVIGGLFGTSALGYGAYSFAASRRALKNALK